MEYRNSKFLANGNIDCEVKHPNYGWISFTCSKEEYTDLYEKMAKDVLTEKYTRPSQIWFDELKGKEIRKQRDALLSKNVDPIVSNPLRWNDVQENERVALINYRKALLEITDQKGFPNNVVWPVCP